jgi:hypothetical protein
VAQPQTAEEELLKICLTSMFENSFYESNGQLAERVVQYLQQVDGDYILKLAIFSRNYGLRSINHFLIARYVQNYRGKLSRKKLQNALQKMIWRPDELGEILGALKLLNGGKFVFPNALKSIFGDILENQFDEYQLGKYQNKGDIKICDIINLGHYKGDKIDKLMKGKIETPDTREKDMSSGGDKKEVFTEKLKKRKL